MERPSFQWQARSSTPAASATRRQSSCLPARVAPIAPALHASRSTPRPAETEASSSAGPASSISVMALIGRCRPMLIELVASCLPLLLKPRQHLLNPKLRCPKPPSSSSNPCSCRAHLSSCFSSSSSSSSSTSPSSSSRCRRQACMLLYQLLRLQSSHHGLLRLCWPRPLHSHSSLLRLHSHKVLHPASASLLLPHLRRDRRQSPVLRHVPKGLFRLRRAVKRRRMKRRSSGRAAGLPQPSVSEAGQIQTQQAEKAHLPFLKAWVPVALDPALRFVPSQPRTGPQAVVQRWQPAGQTHLPLWHRAH